MKVIILAICLLSAALAWESFKAGEGPFDHLSNEEFASLYLMSADDAPKEQPPTYDPQEFERGVNMQMSWDWRNSSYTPYTHCVGKIRDQGHCGSCWAHAISEFMSDRYCLEHKGRDTITFAPQYMVDCANSTWQAEGCNGAETQTAIYWLAEYGFRNESCYPYVSGTTEKAGTCSMWQCPSGKGMIRYLMDPASIKLYFNYTNIDIANDIMEDGPLYMSMVVFADFKAYKGGVYYPIDYNVLGTHAVKCLGWGWDDEHKSHYWICANSWTTGWGEQGFFRIGFNNFIGYKAGSALTGYREIMETPFSI